MKRLLIIPLILALSGCEDKNDPYYVPVTGPQVKVETVAAGAWKVERQAKFYAGYQNNEREILIVTDPSGRQFIAITGCGVTEIVRKTKNSKNEE